MIQSNALCISTSRLLQPPHRPHSQLRLPKRACDGYAIAMEANALCISTLRVALPCHGNGNLILLVAERGASCNRRARPDLHCYLMRRKYRACVGVGLHPNCGCIAIALATATATLRWQLRSQLQPHHHATTMQLVCPRELHRPTPWARCEPHVINQRSPPSLWRTDSPL